MNATLESTEIAKYVEHVSPSSLNRFIKCPESWRQKYVLKNPDGYGWKMLVGSADSKAYEIYMLARIAGVRLPVSDLEDAFADYVKAETETNELDWSDNKNPAMTEGGLIDLGTKCVRAYYPVAESMPDPVSVEGWFRIERPSLPLPVIGRLDIELPKLIIERKNTGKAVIDAGWRLQPKIQAAAVGKQVDFHLTTRTKVPAVRTPETDGDKFTVLSSPEKTEATIRMVGHFMAQIEACLLQFGPEQAWPEQGIAHQYACSHCAYKKGCAAWA